MELAIDWLGLAWDLLELAPTDRFLEICLMDVGMHS